MKILVLNAGSSSQKSCLYHITQNSLPEHHPEPIWQATIDWTATAEFGLMEVKANNIKQETQLDPNNRLQGMSQLLESLITGETQVIKEFSEIDIVGHRIVHGGNSYSEATQITPEVKETIRQLIPLAPNHNPRSESVV